MRPTAKFVGKSLRLADLDRADGCAVVLAEERHGAFVDGLLAGLVFDVQRKVVQDGIVDHRLDPIQLSPCHSIRMVEVETEPIGRHQRACLASVPAENGLQGGVEQVGGGVVAHDVHAPAFIDSRQCQVAYGRLAPLDPADVND